MESRSCWAPEARLPGGGGRTHRKRGEGGAGGRRSQRRQWSQSKERLRSPGSRDGHFQRAREMGRGVRQRRPRAHVCPAPQGRREGSALRWRGGPGRRQGERGTTAAGARAGAHRPTTVLDKGDAATRRPEGKAESCLRGLGMGGQEPGAS